MSNNKKAAMARKKDFTYATVFKFAHDRQIVLVARSVEELRAAWNEFWAGMHDMDETMIQRVTITLAETKEETQPAPGGTWENEKCAGTAD